MPELQIKNLDKIQRFLEDETLVDEIKRFLFDGLSSVNDLNMNLPNEQLGENTKAKLLAIQLLKDGFNKLETLKKVEPLEEKINIAR